MRSSSAGTFRFNFVCEICSGPRSDVSTRFCTSCNKSRSKVASNQHLEYASTSPWSTDSSGILTRFHGDLEEILQVSLERELEKSE